MLNLETTDLDMRRPHAVPADYTLSPVPAYRGNPLIEALPAILTTDQASAALGAFPDYDLNLLRQPPEIRLHLLSDATRLFVPLPHHLDFQSRLSRALRDGYHARNSLAKDAWSQLDKASKQLAVQTRIPYNVFQIPTLAVLGISGIGKTLTVARNCELYPQVVQHSQYRGQPFNRLQIVYLMLECPHDGSVKQICLMFFREVDRLLGPQEARLFRWIERKDSKWL